MCRKLFVTLIILIAIVVGALAVSLPRDQFVHLLAFREFFDVSLPILAFGALIKFLCTCGKKCGCGCDKCGCGK